MGRGNDRRSNSPPRYPLFSRTGRTAHGYKEYVVTERGQETNRQKS